MDKRRGGCAPNIAYTLALLGERPYLVATAGQDFREYDEWLQAAGVDTSHVHRVPDKFHRLVFLQHRHREQPDRLLLHRRDGERVRAVASDHPRAGADHHLAERSGAMVQYAEECRAMGVPFIFDPGQQCARLSGDELRDGVSGARLVICNDYEFELVRQKTGMDEAEVLQQASALVITRGEDGCSVYESPSRVDIAAITPHRIVDPTGVGDAFRGGLMKGMALGRSVKESAQLGTVAATYALEHLGGQSHAYTIKEFTDRYAEHFGPLTL
jgi:adenosine kinase